MRCAADDLHRMLFARVPGGNGGSGDRVVEVWEGSLARESCCRVGAGDVRVDLAGLDSVGVALIPERRRVGHVHVAQDGLGRESHGQRQDMRDMHL